MIASTNDLVLGACRARPIDMVRMLPALSTLGPRSAARALRWFTDWEHRDPDRPHAHFGPFGVEPELQGNGIGSVVLREYTSRLDAAGEDSYLETEKPQNVALYQRFGFEVIEENELLGRPQLVYVARRRRARAGAALAVGELFDDLPGGLWVDVGELEIQAHGVLDVAEQGGLFDLGRRLRSAVGQVCVIHRGGRLAGRRLWRGARGQLRSGDESAPADALDRVFQVHQRSLPARCPSGRDRFGSRTPGAAGLPRAQRASSPAANSSGSSQGTSVPGAPAVSGTRVGRLCGRVRVRFEQ